MILLMPATLNFDFDTNFNFLPPRYLLFPLIILPDVNNISKMEVSAAQDTNSGLVIFSCQEKTRYMKEKKCRNVKPYAGFISIENAPIK